MKLESKVILCSRSLHKAFSNLWKNHFIKLLITESINWQIMVIDEYRELSITVQSARHPSVIISSLADAWNSVFKTGCMHYGISPVLRVLCVCGCNFLLLHRTRRGLSCPVAPLYMYDFCDEHLCGRNKFSEVEYSILDNLQ